MQGWQGIQQRPPKILAEWRSRGRGPEYFKIEGGQVRYDWADVRAWLAAQRGRVLLHLPGASHAVHRQPTRAE